MKNQLPLFSLIAAMFTGLILVIPTSDLSAQYRRIVSMRKSCGNCGCAVPNSSAVGGRCPCCHAIWGNERTSTTYKTEQVTKPSVPEQSAPSTTTTSVPTEPAHKKKRSFRHAFSLGRVGFGPAPSMEDSDQDIQFVVEPYRHWDFCFSFSPKPWGQEGWLDFSYEFIRAPIFFPGSPTIGELKAHEVSIWMRFQLSEGHVKWYFSPVGLRLAVGHVAPNAGNYFYKEGDRVEAESIRLNPSIGWGVCGTTMSIPLSKRFSIDFSASLLEKTSYHVEIKSSNGLSFSEKIQPGSVLLPWRMAVRCAF